MNWQKLNALAQLVEINQISQERKVLIFKHSTRCSISAAALNRLERAWKNEEMQEITPYYLDLINYREISNQIAQDYGIMHESPQIILIENGKAIYNASHFDIRYEELKELIEA